MYPQGRSRTQLNTTLTMNIKELWMVTGCIYARTDRHDTRRLPTFVGLPIVRQGRQGRQGTRLGNKRSNGINSKSSKAMVHFAAFSQALMLASTELHRLHRLHSYTGDTGDTRKAESLFCASKCTFESCWGGHLHCGGHTTKVY